MVTEMGEYVVGAYLKIKLNCDFVGYNTRPPESGLAGLAEIDVVGLDFTNHIAYLCEVTTHLDGLLYGSDYGVSAKKIRDKYERLISYRNKYLHEFKGVRCMFWSPRVPKGKLLDMLKEIEKDGLELILNGEYKKRVEELRQTAKKTTRDVSNPFFRALQILEHLRD
jgi:hypothetical protein